MTGDYVSDPRRSETTLEPLMAALGVPWAARKLMNAMTTRLSYNHVPGRLDVVTNGKPTGTFVLDGVERDKETPGTKLGRPERRITCTEDVPRSRVVVLSKLLLPERLAGGTIRDVYTVIEGGAAIHREVDIRMPRQPPARVSRILTRVAGSTPPAMRAAPAADGV